MMNTAKSVSFSEPEKYIKVATPLFRRDMLHVNIVQILEESYFTNTAGSRITTTPLRKPETMFTPVMDPEEYSLYTLTESIGDSSTSSRRRRAQRQ